MARDSHLFSVHLIYIIAVVYNPCSTLLPSCFRALGGTRLYIKPQSDPQVTQSLAIRLNTDIAVHTMRVERQ